MRDKKQTVRNLIIYVVLTLGLSIVGSIIYYSPSAADKNVAGLGQLLWILAPLVIMVLVRIVGKEGWKDLGLRPNFKGNGFWWFVSIFIFPVTMAISIYLGALAGGISLDGNQLSLFINSLLAGFIASLVKNVFEEFAWRGYLAPRIYSLKINILLSHGIIGLIWGAWHLPFVYLFWQYLTPEMLWYFVPMFLIGTISHSVVYGEIRIKTDSVLPAWIMHTIGNTLGNTLLISKAIQLTSGKEVWFSPGPEGIISIILMFGIGYYLHYHRIKQQS